MNESECFSYLWPWLWSQCDWGLQRLRACERYRTDRARSPEDCSSAAGRAAVRFHRTLPTPPPSHYSTDRTRSPSLKQQLKWKILYCICFELLSFSAQQTETSVLYFWALTFWPLEPEHVPASRINPWTGPGWDQIIQSGLLMKTVVKFSLINICSKLYLEKC